MRNFNYIALILSFIVLVTATSCSATSVGEDTLQQPSVTETVNNDSNEITPEAGLSEVNPVKNVDNNDEATTEPTTPKIPDEINDSGPTPETGIQANTDNQEEAKPAYEIYYVDGVSHINTWMPTNPYTIDTGYNTSNLKSMYTYADAVIVATLEEYHGELYDNTVYMNVDLIPVTVSIESVIKGEVAVGEDLLFGYYGGQMTIEQYKEFVDPDFVDGYYPEDTVVDCSFGGQQLPETGKRYLIFLEKLDSDILSEKNPEMKYDILGINEGLYYLTDGVVSQGVNDYGDEQTIIANLMDKEWLTYVEKPDWAISITYIPDGMGITMQNSGSSDIGYRMVYSKAPCDEYPNGISYSIRQEYNEGKTSDSKDFVLCTPEKDKPIDMTISGVSVRLVKLMNFRNDMAVYFSLPDVDVLVSGVYVTDETELLKIAEAMINEYQKTKSE